MAGSGRDLDEKLVRALGTKNAAFLERLFDGEFPSGSMQVVPSKNDSELVRLEIRCSPGCPRQHVTQVLSNGFARLIEVPLDGIAGNQKSRKEAPVLYIDQRPETFNNHSKGILHGACYRGLNDALAAACERLLNTDRVTAFVKAALAAERSQINANGLSLKEQQRVDRINAGLAEIRVRWLSDRVQRWLDTGGAGELVGTSPDHKSLVSNTQYGMGTITGVIPVVANSGGFARMNRDMSSTMTWDRPKKSRFDNSTWTLVDDGLASHVRMAIVLTPDEYGQVHGTHQYVFGVNVSTVEDAQRLLIDRHARLAWFEIKALLEAAAQYAPIMREGRDFMLRCVQDEISMGLAMFRCGLMDNGVARKHTIPAADRKGLPDILTPITAASEDISQRALSVAPEVGP